MYKVIVPSNFGFGTKFSEWEDALEFALDCKVRCAIVNLETGETTKLGE